MYTDKQLVERILSGNESAFTVLVKKYERLVWFLTYRMIGDEEKVKDICQEIFLKVFTSLNKFRFDAKLSTWIATIAYRTTLNEIKKKDNQWLEYKEENITIDNRVATDDPHKLLVIDDNKQIVHNFIDKLPGQYKTVLTLYHLNEFDYNEIQNITGLPAGTVKSYLFRGRKMLKESLEKAFKMEGMNIVS